MNFASLGDRDFPRPKQQRQQSRPFLQVIAGIVTLCFAFASISPSPFVVPAEARTPRSAPLPPPPSSSSSACQLNSARGGIQHVVYIQFDNVHLTRDNPNVPSDLEQMPHLLNFLKTQGVLLTNHHTPLIAHTSDDIITSLTGVYGDRHGQPVGNSYNFFNPNASDGLGSNFASSFTYWTDPVDGAADSTYSLLTAGGMNAP